MKLRTGLCIPLCLTALLLSLFQGRSDALNEPTHELVNEQAAKGSLVDRVMRQELGMSDGISAEFKRNNALRWIMAGGTLEDAGTLWEMLIGKARFFRHFHNPLQPWDRAGLRYLLFPRFESSVRWAQRDSQDSVTGHGNFSWLDARRYYLRALTSADPSVREQAFADTFQGLGQVMHLVVDASVPEHVREDVHPMGAVLDKLGQVGNYEYWVLAQHRRSGTAPAFIQQYLTSPITLDPELLRIPIPSSEPIARVPIARLWDTDRYVGTNPEVTAEPRVGIAEIANANFLSEDTRGGQYPHPALANMQEYTGVYSKTGARRVYFRKPGAGLAVDPIATECGLDELTGFVDLCVDDDVWRETARQMLPRAVRYSQEVLDYFFRGKLDVDLVEDETDPSLFRLTGTNASPEALVDGTLAVYADDPAGVRSPVPTFEELLVRDVGPEQELAAASFRAPENTERFVAVYQGTLGQEVKDPGKNFPGAVIGKVMGGVRVEEVFFDWPGWKLRTPKGVYRLPIPSEFEEVRWGDDEDTLVGISRFGPGDLNRPEFSRAPRLMAAYRVERQPGSADPVTDDTPQGPEVRLTSVATATFPVGLDLGTTVDHTHTLSYRQQLLTYDNGDERIEARIVASQGQSFPANFRVVLDPAHFEAFSTECVEFGGTICPHTVSYAWSLADVAVDASGHLLALVKVLLTVPPESLRPRVTQPLYGLDSRGGQVVLEECSAEDPPSCFPLTVELFPSYPAEKVNPLLWALVDLTTRTLLTSTAGATVTITSREGLEAPYWVISAVWPNYSPIGKVPLVYRTADGRYWEGIPVWQIFDEEPPPERLTDFSLLEEIRLEVSGWLRPNLQAALAGPFAPPPPPEEPPAKIWWVGGQTGLRVTGPETPPSPSLPPQFPDARRARPAPGGERLVFLATGQDAASDSLDAILVWDPRTGRAQVRQQLLWGGYELGPATRDTVLVHLGWSSILVPLEGSAGPTVFSEPLWDFRLLDPHYLYNPDTGRFYRLKPPLQATALPARLADIGWHWPGDYHVTRLP